MNVRNNFFLATYAATLNIVSSVKSLLLHGIHTPVMVNQMQNYYIEFESLGEPSCACIRFSLESVAYDVSVYGTSQTICNSFYPGIKYAGIYNTTVINGTNTWIFKANMYKVGYVTLTVKIVSSISESNLLSTSLNVVNQITECQDPTLDIEHRSSYFYEPTVYKRNDLFTVISIVKINCNLTLTNVKRWSIFKVNEMSGRVVSEIILNENLNPTINYAELVMQPNSLKYGVYRIVFTLLMSNTNTLVFRAKIDTHIQIVPSGIVVSALGVNRLDGGGTIEITRGISQNIQFNPFLNSYDIDSVGDMSSLMFRYYCQVIDNGIENGYLAMYLNTKVDLNMFVVDDVLEANMTRNKTCFDSICNL